MTIALFVITVVVMALDLITKFTIPGIINPGISWGLGQQWPWLWVVVVILTLVVVGLALVWWFHTKHRKTWLLTVGLGLFLGGALGNLIDRLISGGAVHDWWNWFGWFHNNLADVALIVGAGLLFVWWGRHALR